MPTAQLWPGQGLPTNWTMPAACESSESSPTATWAVPSTAQVLRCPNTSAASGEFAVQIGSSPGTFVAAWKLLQSTAVGAHTPSLSSQVADQSLEPSTTLHERTEGRGDARS